MYNFNYDINLLNERFKDTSAHEIVKWSIENLTPEIAMTSSFQISGIVLMHIIRQYKADFPIYFIDTRFHFKETLAFRDKLIAENFNIKTITSDMSLENFKKKYTDKLYEKDPDLCCSINKIEPLKKFKRNSKYKYWISALRKDQSTTRKNHLPFMADKDGFIRIHPLLNFTWKDVWQYIKQHNLSYNPLYDKGYTSIGCSPLSCTTKGDISEGERSGRWKQSKKTECGLHEGLL